MVFRPIGNKSRHLYVVDWAKIAIIGATIDYRHLGEMMGTDDRAAIQAAVRRALKVLEAEHHRTLETVYGTGYKVADVQGHLKLSTHQQSKASRALKRGLSKVVSVDLNRVNDPEVRRQVEVAANVLADQLEIANRAAASLHSRRQLFMISKRRAS